MATPSKKEIGKRIKAVRGDRSQINFAEFTGIPKNTLGRYERGEIMPGAEAIALLCEATGVDPYWLLFGEGPMKRSSGKPGDTDMSGQSAGDIELQEENTALKDELAKLQWQTSVPVLGLAECGINGWQVKKVSSLKTQPPPDMTDPKDTFAVIAFGDSMVPLGINDGFLLYCDEGSNPAQFDIVYVEALDNRATVKQFVGYLKKGSDEYLALQGFLPSKDGLPQEPFTLEILKSQVARIAVVRYIKRGL
jgi:SOS-response transcriptional repressor LexA